MTWVWVILALLYILSPYDLIPDFIPLRGWIDDIVVLVLLYRFLSKIRRQHAYRRTSSGTSGAQSDPGAGNRQQAARDPYEVLQVPPNASDEQIKSAYRKLASQYHPDKVAHLGAEFRDLAENRFKEIQEAYQRITDSRKR